MTDEVIYEVDGAVATLRLNRPDKYNTLRTEVISGLRRSLESANRDPAVKVIVLEGAGDAFCGGFDFSGGLEHYAGIREDGYDPGQDVHNVTNVYTSYIETFMGLWRGDKPSIAKVHGYCVGGGSELALCADLVVASDCARIGTPYSRVWGCHLTGMWVYRLGLAKAKYYALTGEWISGAEAARIELINEAHPLEELDDAVAALADRLASIPLTQLVSMKLIVNQAYENMGLRSTQTLGPIGVPRARNSSRLRPSVVGMQGVVRSRIGNSATSDNAAGRPLTASRRARPARSRLCVALARRGTTTPSRARLDPESRGLAQTGRIPGSGHPHGIMRNTPEGRDFVRTARDEGVRAAITERDGPFGDYSQGAPEDQPRRRSELNR